MSLCQGYCFISNLFCFVGLLLMARITVTLEDQERDALIRYASDESRDPRKQAEIIIGSELVRKGYLRKPHSGSSSIQGPPEEKSSDE